MLPFIFAKKLTMRVHFIAIGGSAMHNLAIALHLKGYEISGSDDEIFEPSYTRLKNHGLLPVEMGWSADNISAELDAVILGMHARIDNPELLEAQKLGLKIYSYPEYLYEQSKNKKRVVIGGSHGKTTITAMIMHVLRFAGIDFDYMAGAMLEGFDTMVKLSNSAKIAVFEGDEYLTSPIDLRPKFHLYKPHIALVTGIAWDHINVFPTFENYVNQFEIFVDLIEKNGSLIYCETDENLCKIAQNTQKPIDKIAYTSHPSIVRNQQTFLLDGNQKIALQIFGEHNLQNISGAKEVCNKIGVTDEVFYQAISTFNGAAKRLQKIAETAHSTVFLDFAHSPSKLKATVEAVKAQFSERELIACFELHTFSSLSENFLPHYRHTMTVADKAIVFFNPHTIEHKKLKAISESQVAEAFDSENISIFTDSEKLFEHLLSLDWKEKNLLLMSSGNFAGRDLVDFAKKIADN